MEDQIEVLKLHNLVIIVCEKESILSINTSRNIFNSNPFETGKVKQEAFSRFSSDNKSSETIYKHVLRIFYENLARH